MRHFLSFVWSLRSARCLYLFIPFANVPCQAYIAVFKTKKERIIFSRSIIEEMALQLCRIDCKTISSKWRIKWPFLPIPRAEREQSLAAGDSVRKKSRLDGNRRPFPLRPAGKRPRSPMPRITGIEIRRHVTDREKHNRARNMPVCGKRTTQSSSRRRCHRNEIWKEKGKF